MSNIQTGAERMPHDLSHLGFLAGQIGRLITISTTPVIAGDSFRSEERFSRNAETDLVCRLLLEKKKKRRQSRRYCIGNTPRSSLYSPLSLHFPSAYPAPSTFFFFFFNDTATTEIYTLSLHDALPIFKLAPSVCRMTFPILASLLVRLVVLLPFQLLRLSLATPSRWTPLALSVFLHCVVALLLTLL